MHACPLKLFDWEPVTEHDKWVSDVVSRNPALHKCVLDRGLLQMRGVALSVGEQVVCVEIENTICDRCGVRCGPCAVPDFGLGSDAYREFVFQHAPERCPNCEQVLSRRHVLRRLA